MTLDGDRSKRASHKPSRTTTARAVLVTIFSVLVLTLGFALGAFFLIRHLAKSFH